MSNRFRCCTSSGAPCQNLLESKERETVLDGLANILAAAERLAKVFALFRGMCWC
jgi:hypothetical protein